MMAANPEQKRQRNRWLNIEILKRLLRKAACFTVPCLETGSGSVSLSIKTDGPAAPQYTRPATHNSIHRILFDSSETTQHK